MSENQDRILLDYSTLHKPPVTHRFRAYFFSIGGLLLTPFVIEGLHATIIPAVFFAWLFFMIAGFWAIWKTFFPSDRTTRRPAIGASILWLLGLLMGISSATATDPHYWYRHNRIAETHLRAIGQALLSYASEHNGHFPDSLEELVLQGKIPAEDLICPFTEDMPATGPTTQALALDLAHLHHNSFVYIGKGMDSSVPPDAVVAYQWPINSERMGPFVLYGDGSVYSVNENAMYRIISQLRAGHNPP